MTDQKRYILKVTGKVQGVFYRKHTKEAARELQLSGFVQNKDDGSVYIEAEGDENALLNLVKWCNIGPDEADVYKVEIEEMEPLGSRDFEIRW